MKNEVSVDLERLIAGRKFTDQQIESIRSSITRGEIDTITHAAAGGIALAIKIIREYEQEAQRRSS